jgi:hypothetical protein
VTTYKGFDVLDQSPHNAREEIAESFSRLGTLSPNPTGRRTFDDHAELSFPMRSFQWTAGDRASCDALRAFLVARKGRLVPFWTPTFAWDMVLNQDAAADESVLHIERSGYVEFLWAFASRRDIAIVVPGQPFLLRRIITVETVGNENLLHLDALLGVDAGAAMTRVSFLVLCRLADDMSELHWSSSDVCEAVLRFIELPKEVPA